jgi:DNA invertase Pin-like site-specific DNA recombinase
MRVIYGRISSAQTQNEARQLEKGIIAFIDKCSGAVPFMERPQAKKLIEYLKKNPTCETEILSVDRIGRSTLDILQTIQYFKKNDFTLKINNLGMDNSSPFFDLMISLLGTLAEHERAVIKERCRGGIEVAKSNGVYIGRKKGTIDDRNRTLKKHQDIVTCLNSKMKVADICRLIGKHRATIQKVKDLL